MYYLIKKLESDVEMIKNLQNFMFDLIKEEYGIGYIPKYHYDIVNLKQTYLTPVNNNFYFAINPHNQEIMGTIGIRGYDKDCAQFKDRYNENSTASFWRLFINKKYRRNHIGSNLVKIAEEFVISRDYEEIYLHTQKSVIEGYEFWKSLNYNVTSIEDDDTVHMEKKLILNS